MAISKQDRQALDQIFSEYKDKYGGRAEDYYALVYLQRKFKCEASVIAHQIAFGNNDFGLNTAVGLEALTKNTTGLGNTAVGAGTTAHGLAPARPTLGSNTTGGFNTAIGTISKMRSEPCERIWKR